MKWMIIFCLALGQIATAEKKLVQLESADGRTIEAELLEKGKDKVKLRLGRKVYTLPFDQLSEKSAKMVKDADIPVMCRFKLDVDFSKRGTKMTRDRKVQYQDSDGYTSYRTETDSYRVDTITGQVIVRNQDVADKSPPAKLYVVVLCNGKNANQVIRREVFTVNPIRRLGENGFKVKPAKTWHTPRGMSMNPVGTEGRYSGYIAAIVIDGRIVEIKAAPSTFETDIDAAKKLLKIGAKR